MDNKQEVSVRNSDVCAKLTSYLQVIDIIETVYRGASKGRGLVVSPKGALLVAFVFSCVDFIDVCRLLNALQVLDGYGLPIVSPSLHVCHQ